MLKHAAAQNFNIFEALYMCKSAKNKKNKKNKKKDFFLAFKL